MNVNINSTYKHNNIDNNSKSNSNLNGSIKNYINKNKDGLIK